MNNYIIELRKELDSSLSCIDNADVDILKRAYDGICLLERAFEQLKKFIHSYTFKDEAEEVLFFKEIKPELFCQLIYHRKVYNIELNRPKGGEAIQKEYLDKENRC